jgi:hypothetical protein
MSTFCQRIRNHVSKTLKKDTSLSKESCCRPYEYLNINDDFKSSLLWLSIFIPTFEGVGMRILVNYRSVLQSNYFLKTNEEESIRDAVYRPDGDTFQNSPIKFFFCAFPTSPSKEKDKEEANTAKMTLRSISQVSINAKDAKLPSVKRHTTNLSYTNITLENSDVQCLWPREEDLSDFLFVLGWHPHQNLGKGIHDFPWNSILSKFNNQDIKDPSALRYMQRELGLDIIYQERFSFQQNLHVFREFFQMTSPMSCSATEGDYLIDLANQLLYGFMLKQDAPFCKKNEDFLSLPFDSTVFKPIATTVFLPHEKRFQSLSYCHFSLAIIEPENCKSKRSLHQR